MAYKMKGFSGFGKSPLKQKPKKGKIIGENTGQIKEDDKENDAYIIATLNETLDKINDIVFLSLAQEQKLHDLATRVQVLRDEVLKIHKNR